MTGASKILTVSYGTFSCTLEGFDDPFNTMKAIAEYFRDLAAGDRYFGAEPPVPDAAMLHRIAEREIHRRVEAKIQDNGVILRAGDAEDAPLLSEQLRPSVAVADTTDSDAESGAESVAARLQRIRARHNASQTVAVVAAAEPTNTARVAPVQAEIATEVDYSEDDYTEDQHAEPIADFAYAEDALFTPAAPKIDVPDQIETILDEAENDLALIDISDQFADLPDAEDYAAAKTAVAPGIAPDASAPETAFEHDAAEAAILASLQDLLPEDAAAAQDPGEPEATTEDYDTAEFAPELASEIHAPHVAVADIDGSVSDAAFDDDYYDEDDMLADAEVEDPVAADWTPNDLGNDDAMLSRLVADQGPAANDLTAAPPATPAALTGVTDDTDAAMLDRLVASQTSSLIEMPDQAALADATDDAPQAAAPRARARVIRIRRADPAPVLAADTEQTPAPAPAATAPVAVENTALSDEAEAALQAELAELEAELNADIAQPAVAAPVAKAVEPRRHVQAPAEDDAVNRLMAHANSEMGGEETRRRQSAIAHLKAAVAATEADRIALGGSAPKADGRMEAYRGDLDRVVRPRRPVADAKPAADRADPPATRPTPLVLVSAQRIERAPAPSDSAAPRVVMPVRPRRTSGSAASLPSAMADDSLPAAIPAAPISPAGFDTTAMAKVMQEADQSDLDEDDILSPDEDENVFADATSFEDFADQLGASQLSDLLEAAAVYCAEILQRPEFSRPLVMRQIASLPGHGSTSREDYLRGFGTLLRQGRIAKVKRGMFALTDRSPYLAEARKIAG